MNDQTVGLGSFNKKNLVSALAIVVATSLVAPVAFGQAAPAATTGTGTATTGTATTTAATTTAATTTAAATTAAVTTAAAGTVLGVGLGTAIVGGILTTAVLVGVNDAAQESGVAVVDNGNDGTTDTGTTGTTDTGTTDTGTTSTASTASTGT